MGGDTHGFNVIGESLVGEAEEAAAHRPQAPSPLMMMDDMGRDVKVFRRREIEGGLVGRRFLEALELGMVGAASAGRPGGNLSRFGEA
jgi:hypothetical protein